MKFEKGIHWKVFSVFSTLVGINIIMLIFNVLGFKNIEFAYTISGIIGIGCGFASNGLIKNIPYDEDDNYDMLFLSFIILLVLLLVFQSVYFHK